MIKTYQLVQTQFWLKELQQRGCVVIKNIISPQQVKNTIDLFWEWLEALDSGIKRNEPVTWNDKNWPGAQQVGFFISYGGCHTKASWFLRTHPNVKSAFSKIYNTQSLITSFDTFISWRPWWNPLASESWKPYVQNLHVDQNPYYKKGFHCVQGMIPLVDVKSDGVGGLMVVPQTNNDKTQSQLCQRYKMVEFNNSDWLELKSYDQFIGKGQLVQCSAGSLILFDSRTVHGGKICQPGEDFKVAHENQLARLAMTVTMVPKKLQDEQIRQKRLKAFKMKIGLTHWPQEFNKSGFGSVAENIKRQKIKYQYPTLTPQINDLI